VEDHVSVIIRAFNSEKYIEDALKSLINQDYEGVISIVVCYDEGSSDKTLDIILRFQESISLKRIVKIVRHTHLTPFRALQKCGFENVDGEYVFFLDYDNYYPSNYIREVVNEAMKYNASFVFTRALVVDKYGQKLHWLSEIPKNPYDRCRLIKGNYVDTSTIMLKKDCLNDIKKFIAKIDSPYYDWLHEDWLIALLAMKYCKPLYVEKTHVYYRVHETNITAGTGTFQKRVKNIEREIKTLLAFYEIEKDSLNKCEINALKESIIGLLLNYMKEIHKHTSQKNFLIDLIKVISSRILRKIFKYIKDKT
jgi:glycosyltransferase involved in cell wall biosynthesis